MLAIRHHRYSKLTNQPFAGDPLRRHWLWLFAVCLALISWGSTPTIARAAWGDAVIPVGTANDFTQSAAWGDMDSDGDLDIVVGNYGDPNRIYENRAGTFVPYWESADAAPTASVAWGDMEGDGDLDLAVGNVRSATQVFRNDGGQFVLAWQTADTTRRTSTVAWVDWNQDGRLDLAVANGAGFVEPQPNQLFENTGTGFTLAWQTPAAEVAITYSMAWGDWDGDGDLDPVFGNRGLNQVYRNSGGDLQLFQTLAGSGYDTVSVAWGDWDGDDDLDLVFGNQIDAVDSRLTGEPNQVYRNGPDGFVEVWRSAEASITESVAWGDADGDGDLDLAVGNKLLSDDSAIQGVQIYENQGANLVLTWHTTGLDTSAQSVAWGDMDNDGDLDLLSGEPFRPSRIYENSTNNFWTAQPITAIEPAKISHMEWGDADADGDLDLAVSESPTVRIYINQMGQFTPGWSLPAADLPADPFAATRATWGDWNGDGRLDLAISIEQRLAVYENGGDNFTCVWQSEVGLSTISSLAWGDWDNDGDLDLAVGRAGSPNQIYANLTTGFAPVWTSSDSKITYAVAWGDMDNDGDLDLAVGNGKAMDNMGNADGEVNQVFENSGGDLTLAWESTDVAESRSIAWGDVDGDGDLDLAVGTLLIKGAETFGATNYLYRNTGSDFLAEPLPGPMRATMSIAWGDGDGDGDLDLAVGNDGAGDKTQLFRNDEGTLNLAWEAGDGDQRTTSIAWGDVDNDGDLDLATGSYLQTNQLYRNYRVGADRLAANLISGSLQQPSQPAAADLGASTAITGSTVTISYRLHGPDLHRLVAVQGYYSINGGGQWFPATPTPATLLHGLATGKVNERITSDLPAQPFRIFLPVIGGGAGSRLNVEEVVQLFTWDAAQAGLRAGEHQVRFRLDVFSGYGPFTQAKSSIYTEPFRLHMPAE